MIKKGKVIFVTQKVDYFTLLDESGTQNDYIML